MDDALRVIDQRRFVRYDVNWVGQAVFPTGTTTIRVLDLSLGGARIALPLPFASYQAEIRQLRLPDIALLACSRRWSTDRLVGVQFDQPEQAYASLRTIIAQLEDRVRSSAC